MKKPIHNNLVEIVLKRVKNMLGYPESAAELINPSSVLYRLGDFGYGKKRSAAAYYDMVGIHPITKEIRKNEWCHLGNWPPEAIPYRKSGRRDEKG